MGSGEVPAEWDRLYQNAVTAIKFQTDFCGEPEAGILVNAKDIVALDSLFRLSFAIASSYWQYMSQLPVNVYDHLPELAYYETLDGADDEED